ncbi:MAG: tetratricopeptide repeat protein [Candidatus Komeilibacteria bacterium]|nr:tetratricopeptide repeat protein [Candidatus Komeilibacteria bacterium]
MLNLILLIIIVGCAFGLGWIVFKKLAKVAMVDSETSPVVKQSAVKKRLMEERLQRKVSAAGGKVLSYLKPAFKLLVKVIRAGYQKSVDLEEHYRHKVLHASFKDKVQIQQYASQLLTKAAALLEQERLTEAEKAYLEILKLDEKNAAAYQGLGELYLLKKDHEHAREIFEFLLRLNENNPLAYYNLGAIASKKGDLKQAQEQYLKSLELDAGNIGSYLDLAGVYLNLDEPNQAWAAVNKAAVLEPNNPKILDFLIEVSIITRDKDAARRAYQRLKEVNPENQKLPELKEKIDSL